MIVNPTNAHAKTKYAKTTVHVREEPNTKSNILGKLHWNDSVEFIKRYNKKWSMVSYKNRISYIYSNYLRSNKKTSKSYSVPSKKTFKSFEDADCITDSTSLLEGRLKKQYHLDPKSGVYMIGDRYCIAVGSYYTKKAGVKIDLILKHKGKTHILNCITADCKADKDTINKHRIHSDGSVVEFIVKTSALPRMALKMGDISYAGKKFQGRVKRIKVYRKVKRWR